ELGFEDHAQRSLGADHDLRQVHGLCGVGEFVQVVATHSAEDFGVTAIDLGGVLGGESQHRIVAGGFERIAGRGFACWDLAEVDEAAVGKSDNLFQHVVEGFAVEHDAGAARVVRHHAADGGAAGGGDIGGESHAE